MNAVKSINYLYYTGEKTKSNLKISLTFFQTYADFQKSDFK